MMYESVRARLVADEDTGCLVWTGARNGSGYGHVGRGGRWFQVHRVVYAAEVGPIPDGHVLHHECENLVCANSEHLTPMTPEQHRILHMSEFSDADVAALIDEGLTRREISAFGISPKRIARVRRTFREGEPRAASEARSADLGLARAVSASPSPNAPLSLRDGGLEAEAHKDGGVPPMSAAAPGRASASSPPKTGRG